MADKFPIRTSCRQHLFNTLEEVHNDMDKEFGIRRRPFLINTQYIIATQHVKCSFGKCTQDSYWGFQALRPTKDSDLEHGNSN